MEMHERFFAVTRASVRRICDTKRISLILNAATLAFITARALRCAVGDGAKNCPLFAIRLKSAEADASFIPDINLTHAISSCTLQGSLSRIFRFRDKNIRSRHSHVKFHTIAIAYEEWRGGDNRRMLASIFRFNNHRLHNFEINSIPDRQSNNTNNKKR